MEKACTKCKVEKELSEFYRHKRTKDGRRWSCISCYKARYQKPEVKARVADSRREYGQRPHVLASEKVRSRTPNRIATSAASSTKYRRKYKERRAAANKIYRLVKSGGLPAASSLVCDVADDTCLGLCQYHHDSYLRDDWLKVRPLCRSHHRRWHAINSPIEFEADG